MAIFVLVHGGWDSGWAWKEVAQRLRAAGHEAYRPSLTGTGERAHLLTPEVGLDTYVMDVVNLLRYDQLDSVVLVGASAGGMVITGVAEAEPKRIARLIYLDGFAPLDGQSITDMCPPEIAANLHQVAQEHGDGWRIPLQSDEPRMTAYPVRAMDEPLAVNNPAAAAIPRTFVHHTAKTVCAWMNPIFQGIADRVRDAEGWEYLERPWMHYPVCDQESGSKLVAELLLELVA